MRNSVLFVFLLILSGTLIGISYQDYLQGNYEIGDHVEHELLHQESPWETVYCQEPEKNFHFEFTTNETAYNSDYIAIEAEGDYIQSLSNPNLWYIHVSEDFTVPGLDGWTHCIFKGNGYNKSQYVVQLIKCFNVESDGSLAYDCTDYIKHAVSGNVPCNHIFGD